MGKIIKGDFPDPMADHEARIAAAERLIPAWFVRRMMEDTWSFGLLLDSGDVLCIETIDSVRRGADGTLWIDVHMLDSEPYQRGKLRNLIVAPTSRTRASIRASRVVAAFEMADT